MKRRNEGTVAFVGLGALPDVGGRFPRQLTPEGEPIGRSVALPLCSALADGCTPTGTQQPLVVDDRCHTRRRAGIRHLSKAFLLALARRMACVARAAREV